MSELLCAMKSCKDVFQRYAGKEGDNKTLSKKELSDLLHEQFGMSGSDADKQEFFAALDNDGDNTVNFEEFMVFVTSLCIILGEGCS
ncbi:protein S100-G-like [Nelusetta ayraudi]|uniref:protein S100-G-like n=1 Tax=Nelusetta ayraudi TaxID=303726 RepID=UPI003F715858